MVRAHLWILGAATALALVACGPVRPDDPPAAAPATVVDAATIATWYRIDRQLSLLQARVRPGGTLARLGHHHIIASRDLSGQIGLAANGELRQLAVTLPFASLEIDPDDLRAAAGGDFAKAVPQKDRDGTRANLLGDALLQATSFPALELRAAHAVPVNGETGAWLVQCRVRVRGSEWPLELPVTVRLDAGQLTATGVATITHQQIGLTPFSVGLGALRVEDDIELHFTLVASRQ